MRWMLLASLLLGCGTPQDGGKEPAAGGKSLDELLSLLARGPATPDRVLVARVLRALEDRPLEEQGRILEGLLATSDRNKQSLALEGLLRMPPRDPKILLPHLMNHGYLVARLLIAAGDRSVCAGLLPLIQKKPYSDTPPPGFSAAEAVLSALGAPGREKELISLAHSDLLGAPLVPGILAATPGDAAEAVLAELADAPDLKTGIGWRALRILALREKPGAVERLIGTCDALSPDILDSLVRDVRHPDLVRAWVARLRKENRADGNAKDDLNLAALAGPAIRDLVVDWLKVPALGLPMKTKLIGLLGAVGGDADRPFLRGLLKEPGLQDAAAEALGRIGDPDDARPLMDGFRVYKNGLDYGAAFSFLPLEGLEKDFEEIFGDPTNHPYQLVVALNLARRSPLPRIRAALFKGLLDNDGWVLKSRISAIQILEETIAKADEPAVALLRASDKPDVRASGLALAFALGDEAAAVELVGILAGYSFISSDSPVLLSRLPPAKTIVEAVEAAWQKRPDWEGGRDWLALHGHAAALKQVRAKTWGQGDFWRLPPPLRLAVALREPGGPTAMLDLLDQDRGRGFTPEDLRLLAAALDGKTKERLLLRARGRARDSEDPSLSVLAAGAFPEAVDLFREAVGKPRRDLSFIPGCARALGRLKITAAVPELRALLRSPDADQRAAAIEALAALGDRDSIPAIARLLEDPAPVFQRTDYASYWRPLRRRVWHAAMEALESLTGKKTQGRSTSDRRTFWRESLH